MDGQQGTVEHGHLVGDLRVELVDVAHEQEETAEQERKRHEQGNARRGDGANEQQRPRRDEGRFIAVGHGNGAFGHPPQGNVGGEGEEAEQKERVEQAQHSPQALQACGVLRGHGRDGDEERQERQRQVGHEEDGGQRQTVVDALAAGGQFGGDAAFAPLPSVHALQHQRGRVGLICGQRLREHGEEQLLQPRGFLGRIGRQFAGRREPLHRPTLPLAGKDAQGFAALQHQDEQQPLVQLARRLRQRVVAAALPVHHELRKSLHGRLLSVEEVCVGHVFGHAELAAQGAAVYADDRLKVPLGRIEHETQQHLRGAQAVVGRAAAQFAQEVLAVGLHGADALAVVHVDSRESVGHAAGHCALRRCGSGKEQHRQGERKPAEGGTFEQGAEASARHKQHEDEAEEEERVGEIGDADAPHVARHAQHAALPVGVVRQLHEAEMAVGGDFVHAHRRVQRAALRVDDAEMGLVVLHGRGSGMEILRKLHQLEAERQRVLLHSTVVQLPQQHIRGFALAQMHHAPLGREVGGQRAHEDECQRGMHEPEWHAPPQGTAQHEPQPREGHDCPQRREPPSAVNGLVGECCAAEFLHDGRANHHQDEGEIGRGQHAFQRFFQGLFFHFRCKDTKKRRNAQKGCPSFSQRKGFASQNEGHRFAMNNEQLTINNWRERIFCSAEVDFMFGTGGFAWRFPPIFRLERVACKLESVSFKLEGRPFKLGRKSFNLKRKFFAVDFWRLLILYIIFATRKQNCEL